MLVKLANLKSDDFTRDQVMVVVYWAVKDICPTHMDKLKGFWADAVNNPHTPSS